jgi:preprotein translocase subunit SecE
VGGKVKLKMITKIRKFISEVFAEMKKVSWTTRKELVDSTLIVIFSSFLLGLFVGIIDYAFSRGVAVIIK